MCAVVVPSWMWVYKSIPATIGRILHSIVGIFLYTRSSVLSLIPTISRVYFYIPATTGIVLHSFAGILLYTRKQSVCMRLPRRTMSSSQWRKVLHYNVIPSEAWESPNPPHLSHLSHVVTLPPPLWHCDIVTLWQALHHNAFHVSLFHFPMFWNNETRNLGI